jgi:hypothetical protein
MKRWLKRIHMTIPWWELERYRQDNLFIGPFKKWLGELLECASLEQVTIELTAQKQDGDKTDRLLREEVLPIVNRLRMRVQCVHVRYCYSLNREIVENWEIVKLSPEEDPMPHQPDITDSQRDRDDDRRRATQLEPSIS